eukprot:scaffold2423_cov113-Isochrysis_galbana.AAC.21
MCARGPRAASQFQANSTIHLTPHHRAHQHAAQLLLWHLTFRVLLLRCDPPVVEYIRPSHRSGGRRRGSSGIHLRTRNSSIGIWNPPASRAYAAQFHLG